MYSTSSTTGYNSDMLPTVHVYRGSKHVFIEVSAGADESQTASVRYAGRWWNLHLKKLLDAAEVTRSTYEEMPHGALLVTDADAAIGVLRLNGCKVIVHE